MSRLSVLARGRAAAVAGMVDACTIRRQTGTTTDPDTGYPTPQYLSPDPYTGACRVQQHQATADQQNPGEDFLLLLRVEIQLPPSVVGLQVGDVVTITASAHDADLVGRVFRIHDLAHKSEATARRVQCVERTAS
jgi:hypothetical protein